MKETLTLLGEETLYQQGSFLRIRRYYAGHHPEVGVITNNGFTGQETISDETVVRPLFVIDVREETYEGAREYTESS